MAADVQPGKSGEKTLVFSKPQQIVEILNEADKLKLPVLIRYTNEGKAVRAFVERADLKNERGIRVAGISAAGESVLSSYEVVKVEFVLLSKKIFFVSRIRARAPSRLLISTPDKVYAIERRLNARFNVPKGMSASVQFEELPVDLTRFDAPLPLHILEPEKLRHATLPIHDISLGGAAITTRYNAVASLLTTDQKEHNATFLFPRMPPLQVPISIRWVKKTTTRLGPQDHLQTVARMNAKLAAIPGLKDRPPEFNEVIVRLGIQFSEISSELDAALRVFIHQAQTAESV